MGDTFSIKVGGSKAASEGAGQSMPTSAVMQCVSNGPARRGSDPTISYS